MLCKFNRTIEFDVNYFYSIYFSLHGVTLNVAARDGYINAAPTVESCRCPANYTGSSCQNCADGYGRPHPLVGIYLGQCWSCRSLCNDRSDRCDRDTGKCLVRRNNSIVLFVAHIFLFCLHLLTNRIVKAIVKAIDVNDVFLAMYSMHVQINAFEKISIKHVNQQSTCMITMKQ
jgi:hypothetical protein